MPHFEANVTLGLTGPFLTKSSAPGAYGLDSVCARNAAGKFFLPWTLVKGRIREAWTELYSLFGSPIMPDPAVYLGRGPSEGGNRSNPAAAAPQFERFNTRLFGTDFILTLGADAEKELYSRDLSQTRIAQDPHRHAAQEDMLQVIESPFVAGETYQFTGVISYDAPSPAAADEIKRALCKSLRWTGAFGSLTTVGFGSLNGGLGWHFVLDPAPPLRDPNPAGAVMWVRFTTTEPLCVTESRSGENLFVAGSTIPGAVFKGALAAQMQRRNGFDGAVVTAIEGTSALRCNFDRIRFAHAHAHKADTAVRPAVIPLSLVRASDGQTFDAARPLPPKVLEMALAFQPDWKDGDWSAVSAAFGCPSPKKELRVRNAMDSDTRRSKTGSLFAYEMIVPRELAWDCRITFPKDLTAAEIEAIRAELCQILANGLAGVGKTKATLKAEVLRAPIPLCREVPLAAAGPFVVTLQTPALLVPPVALRSRDPRLLKLAYAEIFSELSGHSLTLKDFFAQQSLLGGLYLTKRFRAPGALAPYALTNAGSVFIFDAADAETATAKLTAWLRDGLPLPAWSKTAFERGGHDGHHWSNNPFVPENGYGEIAVNLNTANIDLPPGAAHD